MTSEDLRSRGYGEVAVLIATGVSGGRFEGRRFREYERQSSVFVKERRPRVFDNESAVTAPRAAVNTPPSDHGVLVRVTD